MDQAVEPVKRLGQAMRSNHAVKRLDAVERLDPVKRPGQAAKRPSGQADQPAIS